MKHGLLLVDGKVNFKLSDVEWTYTFVGQLPDTGQGLNEESINWLFSPFVRLNVAENVEGTGIGLVISKHLVELMDGTMGVDSTPGEGSTF